MVRVVTLLASLALVLSACGPALEGEDWAQGPAATSHGEALTGTPNTEVPVTTSTSPLADPGAAYLPQDPIPLKGNPPAEVVLPGSPGSPVTVVTGF